MCEADKQYINSCCKDIQSHKGVLNLMICAIENEKICENLQVAIDYLAKASEILSAIESLSEAIKE